MNSPVRKSVPVADSAANAMRKAIIEDYEVLEENVDRLNKENFDLRDTNHRLIQEVSFLREELENRTKDFTRVQAYAVRLSTQVDVILDTCQKAKEEASAQGVKADKTEAKPESRVEEQLVLAGTMEEQMGATVSLLPRPSLIKS